MALTVPPPRSPLADDRDGHGDHAQWYERELGWATTGTAPVRLLTGLRFDVLELPAVAGHAALRRVGRTGPVALTGQTMGLLVAPGSADELPGLLDWLEWGGVALTLTAVGTGGRIIAPAPPGWAAARRGPPYGCGPRAAARGGVGAPGPRRPREQGGDAPDLVRLVDAVATECHRARLTRAGTGRPATGCTADQPTVQPLAFS